LKEKRYSDSASMFSKYISSNDATVHTSSNKTIAIERDFPQLLIQNGQRRDRTRYRIGINCSKGV
jgi:hypothetical protein